MGVNLHDSVASELFNESTLLIRTNNRVVLGALRMAMHFNRRLIIEVSLRVTILRVKVILRISVFEDPFVGRCNRSMSLS